MANKVSVNRKKGLTKTLAVGFFLGFCAYSCQTVNTRSKYVLDNTRWLAQDLTSIEFKAERKGTYKEDGQKSSFTYETKNGFIQITINDEENTSFDLNMISEERLFCVTQNKVYYLYE